MSALILGIDPSSRKIAIAATNLGLPVQTLRAYNLYRTTEKQTPESLARALDYMEETVEELAGSFQGERYAWVEDPLVGRGGPVATMKQSLVQGIVRGVLARSGFTVYGVNVSTWKKAVAGSGRADKDDVRRAVRAAWPKVSVLIGNDSDLADAAAICIYGQGVLSRSADIRQAGVHQGPRLAPARPSRGSVS